MLLFGKRITVFIFAMLCAMIFSSSEAQTMVAMKDAGKHVGEELTVCGTILSIKNLENVKDKPTLINLAYGVEHLDVIVSAGGTALSGLKADSLLFKDVCVTGKLYFFSGTPNTYLKAENIKINRTEIITSALFKEKEPDQKSVIVVSSAADTNRKKKIELYKSKPDPQKKALLMKYMKMGHIVSFSETKDKKTYVILLNEHKKF